MEIFLAVALIIIAWELYLILKQLRNLQNQQENPDGFLGQIFKSVWRIEGHTNNALFHLYDIKTKFENIEKNKKSVPNKK